MHVGGVGKRLAHAHEDDAIRRRARQALSPHVQELVDDLPNAEVARKSQRAGGAESAPHRTSGLGADANRRGGAALARQLHGLEYRPVGGPKEEGPGPVAGDAHAIGADAAEGERHVEVFAEPSRQRRDLVEAAGRSIEDSTTDLVASVAGLVG